MGPGRDLLLIVLTPLAIVPLVWAAQSQWSVLQIAAFVAAFGAMGHQLPGWMRAYGDRELFRQFRVRFMLAPIFLVSASVYCHYEGLKVLGLVVLLWGFWHGFMQVYGFMRIYDAKVGSSSSVTARLDWMMVGLWFGVGLLHSKGHAASMLKNFYDSGGPLISVMAVDALRSIWHAATAAVTASYAVHLFQMWRRGQPPNSRKLALMATSIGFYAYAIAYTPVAILGIALFELFHDSQYLAIVWAHNGRLVEKGEKVDHFTRFLFRATWPMVGLYLALIGAYGFIGFAIPRLISDVTIPPATYGVIHALALLHFYYDGFIWKIRQHEIRKGFDLDGGSPWRATGEFGLPSWLSHGAKWAVLLAFMAAMGWTQLSVGPRGKSESASSIAEDFPSPRSHMNAGVALLNRSGADDLAIQHFEAALQSDPNRVVAHAHLAALYAPTHPNRAIDHLEKAIVLKPDFVSYQIALADLLVVLGRVDEGIEQYEHALETGNLDDPRDERLIRQQLSKARKLRGS